MMDESASADRVDATDLSPTDETSGGAGSTAGLPAESAGNSETKSASPSELDVAAETDQDLFVVNSTEVGTSLPATEIAEPAAADIVVPLNITLNESAELPETNRVPASRPPIPVETFHVGDMLGHFEITRLLGQGGMGRVYEAKDTTLDRPVAVKVLHRHQAQDEATVARFLNEARLAARLNHEHIAQVYFYGQEKGIPYIAFEFVQGENLRKYVDEHGVLSVENAVIFVMQIADALAHAANNGVTHRDVKPSNIIITPQHKAKLIDMGLARTLHSDNPEEDLTVSGITLGTFDYMSPEQAFNPRDADVRSDLYSLGCTFYFMLSGRPPYSDGKGVQKLILHQREDVPDIRQQVPEVPESVAAILRKMMEKNPDDRYQTPEELIADLRIVGEQLGLFLPEGGLVTPEPTPVEETRVDDGQGGFRRTLAYHLPWVCAVLLLIATGGAVWYYGERQNSGYRDDLKYRIANDPFLARPIAPKGKDDPSKDVSDGTLSPYFLGTRRRLPDQTFGEASRSEEFTAATNYPPREYGGIGTTPIASSDILNVVETANLSSDGVRLLETTVDPLSDAASGGWKSLAPSEDSGEKKYAENVSSFREGIDPLVDLKGKKDGCFATVDEAVASFNAWNRSVPVSQRHEVTLRLAFDGEMDVTRLVLSDCALRLLPAPGYSPRLLFRAGNMSEEGEVSLFLLRNARLTISDLSISLDVTDQNMISDSWTLFQFDSRSSLRFDDVRMTIKNGDDAGNPFCPNAAFFRMTFPLPGQPAVSPVSGAESAEPPFAGGELFVSGGVYQGEAALLATPAFLPLKVDIRQGVFLIDGPFVRCERERRGNAAPAKRCDLSIQESFVWCRSPLLRVVSSSALSQSGGLGKEIFATINKSFVAADGNPLGEFVFSAPQDVKEITPPWKISENLFADLDGVLKAAGPRRRSGAEADPAAEADALLGNDNVLFEISPPKLPFWKITREETESTVFNAARKNLESEIARQALDRLVTGLASRD